MLGREQGLVSPEPQGKGGSSPPPSLTMPWGHSASTHKADLKCPSDLWAPDVHLQTGENWARNPKHNVSQVWSLEMSKLSM